MYNSKNDSNTLSLVLLQYRLCEQFIRYKLPISMSSVLELQKVLKATG